MENCERFSDGVTVKGKRKKPPPSISSSTSGGEDCSSSAMSTTTREDEDMANCLILLSHGGFPPPAGCGISGGKFGEVGKEEGVFVYECKTCLRAFSSFQALGGHRASHRKPKADDRRKSPAEDYEEKLAVNSTSPAQKEKIHECSVCGSVFSSGQALGGHMRRHRPPPPSYSGEKRPRAMVERFDFAGEKEAKNILELDLNLPAPAVEEEINHRRISGFAAAALVDCHY